MWSCNILVSGRTLVAELTPQRISEADISKIDEKPVDGKLWSLSLTPQADEALRKKAGPKQIKGQILVKILQDIVDQTPNPFNPPKNSGKIGRLVELPTRVFSPDHLIPSKTLPIGFVIFAPVSDRALKHFGAARANCFRACSSVMSMTTSEFDDELAFLDHLLGVEHRDEMIGPNDLFLVCPDTRIVHSETTFFGITPET
jgi:hypothetical protein